MILPIIFENDPIIRKPSLPILNVNNWVIDLASDMLDTMLKYDGLGLAAPQVGENVRMIVVDDHTKESIPFALINPEIIHEEGEIIFEEGCLSCPGLSAKVKRAEKVIVTGIDLEEDEMTIEANGLFAVILQHEIDHLDGILFIDRLDDEEKKRIERKKKLINYKY